MTQTLTIRAFMVSKIATLTPETEIGHAARMLSDRGIAGAPVVDAAGDLVGMLTKKDCFKAALNAAYYGQWGGAVARYMTKSPETLDIDLDIVSAARAFIDKPYRLFPVTSEGRMVGVLGRSDLLKAFLSSTQ